MIFVPFLFMVFSLVQPNSQLADNVTPVLTPAPAVTQPPAQTPAPILTQPPAVVETTQPAAATGAAAAPVPFTGSPTDF